jgi:hypothetical protein
MVVGEDSEELGFLDEEAIRRLLRVLAPVLTHGQGMRGTENEREAKEALRGFLIRARANPAQ